MVTFNAIITKTNNITFHLKSMNTNNIKYGAGNPGPGLRQA
jgi:hypothetical protein